MKLGWIKQRKVPEKYRKTEQKSKIAEAGKEISKECKGKKGSEFTSCRHEVLNKLFKKIEP